MKGKFTNEEIGTAQRVYVFAAYRNTFAEIDNELREEFAGNVKPIWVTSEEELDKMRGQAHPFIILPPDYKENPITDDYRFRRLVSTGYV